MRTLNICLALALLVCAGPAMAYSWAEVGDAGDLPATAQTPAGGGSLTSITGTLSDGGDADMYRIHVIDPSLFMATSVGGVTFDSQLWLFDTAGHGVTFDDDTPFETQSTLSGTFVPAAGDYFLALSHYDFDALDSGGEELWQDTPFAEERAPDGSGMANPIDHWDNPGDSGEDTYELFLRGVGDGVAPVPEPASVALFGLGLGAAGIGMARRRRERK